ncbi:hypothetical protein [Henriciella litoralis]|uniref:hypothetical protein n=1 Tax=Henriciella litoralis TaxID=568102 RepID=UPI00111C72BF|nr:hypothetical protein [Henriciella litoralis]
MADTGAADKSAVEATQEHFSGNSPIAAIVSDPQAKEVLDRIFPTLTDHAAFDQFKAMSLRQLQPYSDGGITDARIAEAEEAFKAINSDG